MVPHLSDAGDANGECLLTSQAGKEELFYACLPTLRVQTPSEEVATIRPHADGMYGLPEGSINFWVPLTPVSSTAALWTESSPGAEDFHPLTRPTRFDGRRCIHFSVPNRSERTRVSIDFRCVPGALHDPRDRLSRAGYYASMQKVDSTFQPHVQGHVSKLHGLPHKAQPLTL